MAFSSLDLIFRFLPVFLAAYYLTPPAFRNWTLLLGSVVFYAWGVQGRLWMLGLLALLLLLVYGGGLLLAAARRRRGLLAAMLAILFGCLAGSNMRASGPAAAWPCRSGSASTRSRWQPT